MRTMGSLNNNWLMPGHSGKSCCHEDIHPKMNPTADRCFSMNRFLDYDTIGPRCRQMTSNRHVLASCKGSRQAMLAPFCHPDSLFILSCSFFLRLFLAFSVFCRIFTEESGNELCRISTALGIASQ